MVNSKADWRPHNAQTIYYCKKILALMEENIKHLTEKLDEAEHDLYRIDPSSSPDKRTVRAKLDFLETQISQIHSQLNRLCRTTISLKEYTIGHNQADRLGQG